MFADPLKTEDLEIGRFIESKFGNSLLMDKAGYTYRANRKRNSKIYWMCRENKIRGLKCPAKAVTQGVYIIGSVGSEPTFWRVELFDKASRAKPSFFRKR